MRVLFADTNHPILHELLQQAGYTCDLYWDKSVEELKVLLQDYDALVLRSKFPITEELMKSAPRLKCIGRVGAGMENIDLAAAKKLGINCVSAPEGNRDAVGEHALGMLLMLLNHLKKADAEVRKHIWIRAENRGYELGGKTVGIIGYGHMGSSFANKLKGFDCKILAYDKYLKNYRNEFVRESEMQEIFEECDILSLHTPYTEETKYLINADFISQFKKPIYIINTARGKCLKTEDLVKALESGKVLGACLDVLEYESTSFENFDSSQISSAHQYILQSEKVILSPHIAGWTHESNYKMSKIIAERMIACLSKIKK
ncbi:MAG: hydroxyacid dehydrogenase [Sphingobacteriaceae bacterium]|nr:hydroxyacid dehydrogenase [Sphingobacteriaceae bacterium]